MICENVPFVVNLSDEHATQLEIVGGKGANLAILYQRQFCVPDAFIVTTSAFQYTLNNEQFQAALLTIDQLDVDNIKQLEDGSNQMKTIICQIELSNDMIDLIMKQYDRLCEKNNHLTIHVAVRSSATAEDLPDNSFAGQQDTYLHVTRNNLIHKIQQCWASLFTARAISYRKKNKIDHKLVKLAVVVQEMIGSEVSGVAFTANPITGLRNEVVIDSTYGLGEVLVSGLVTPDHYKVLMHRNQAPEIRVKNIGEKSIRIIGKSNGGTETLNNTDENQKLEALSDQYIIQLVILAKEIEKSYQYQPQDLEWSFKQGKFFILQTRPITTLFPIPNYTSNQSDLRCMVSFGTIQGFLDPMTPLGESTIRVLASNLFRKIGLNRNNSLHDDISSDSSRFNIIKSSANRLWVDITGILTSPVGRVFGLSMADVEMGKILNHLNRPQFFPQKSIFSSIRMFLPFLLITVIPLICKAIRNLIFPRYGKQLFINQLEKYHQFVDQGFNKENNRNFTDCIRHFMNVIEVLPSTIIKFGIPCIMPSVISLKVLQKLANNSIDALTLTRAVESNPTTEMNLILWKLTISIRENSSALKLFENETTEKLVNVYRNKSFDQDIQFALEAFFRLYGCRGIGEIDLGRPRWSEQPEVVIEQIKNYLKIKNPDKAITKIHEQSRQSAYEALDRIENQLKYPSIQRPLLNFFFSRLKILFSIRECPKFDGLIRTFDKCRQALFHHAQFAMQENFISRIDDITFLYIGELQSLAFDVDHKQYDKIPFWKDLIEQRRAQYNRHMSYKRIPVMLLSDGTTYYDASTIPNDSNEQIELAEGEFIGSPVSPGVYEGKVRIVDDPMNSQLQPGEILVCTATDPAWTSLFPIVGALVLEMGGMLQHGAIVSREYGLPAVVGMVNAKKIFHNGQIIRVNGSNGRIRILSFSSK